MFTIISECGIMNATSSEQCKWAKRKIGRVLPDLPMFAATDRIVITYKRWLHD